MRWFLFSLVLWSSFALSQPDKKAGGASKGENNPGNNQSISVNLPSNINVGISGNLQVNTEKSDAKTNEEPFKAGDWLLVFFNGLLAIFTALLWCSTQKLWGEAKIASGIAKSAADSSRFWRDAHHPHGFQISRGTKHNRFIQEPIPKPDPLEGDPEDGDGDPA